MTFRVKWAGRQCARAVGRYCSHTTKTASDSALRFAPGLRADDCARRVSGLARRTALQGGGVSRGRDGRLAFAAKTGTALRGSRRKDAGVGAALCRTFPPVVRGRGAGDAACAQFSLMPALRATHGEARRDRSGVLGGISYGGRCCDSAAGTSNAIGTPSLHMSTWRPAADSEGLHK